MMTVRDLFGKYDDLSIDVCDDYDERCYIAFESGYRPTKACAEHFGEFVLDIEVIPQYDTNYNYLAPWTLHCETAKEAQACKELFYSLAGFCSADDFDVWFQEI